MKYQSLKRLKKNKKKLEKMLDFSLVVSYNNIRRPERAAEQNSPIHAAVAHLVERHLAKVEVASSSLVGRSIRRKFSSAGRASALQAEGQRFEPVNFHHVAR